MNTPVMIVTSNHKPDVHVHVYNIMNTPVMIVTSNHKPDVHVHVYNYYIQESVLHESII